MPATNNTTARLTINDFKPGIFSDYHSSTSPSANPGQSTFDPTINGAAVIEDTWGCCADRSGALVPLPRVTLGKSEAKSPASTRGTTLSDNYTLDAVLVDQMQQINSALGAQPEVVVMQNFIVSYDGGSNFGSYIRVRRYEQWRITAPTSDVCFTRSPIAANALNVASGNITSFRGVINEASLTDPAAIRKGFVFVAHPTRRADAIESGTQFADGPMPATDRGFTDYDEKNALDGTVNPDKDWPERGKETLVGYFPNFDTPTFIFPNVTGFLDKAASEDYRGGFLCVGHQGRIVIAQWLPSRYNGDTNNQFTWKDRLSATSLLEMDKVVSSGEFVEENTAGIGLMASMSADEMLVLKHTGGGYLLRGSFASPSVVKLPFMESTYGVVSSPALTPLGLIYGTRNGVFAWSGGETAQHVSPQLDGFFWNHLPTDVVTAGVKYDGHRARFGFWHPWVMAPNGFMLDTRSNGWWRLDDPDTHEAYNVYQVSENNRLYAFPWRQNDIRSTVWNQAEPDVLASSWSWKSQPLVETREQTFKLRDLTVLATATDPGSSITVTISGFNQSGAVVTIPSVTVALSDIRDRPQLVMKDLVTTAESLTYMQVKLVGANSSNGSAPKLHSISFGVLDTKPVRKS